MASDRDAELKAVTSAATLAAGAMIANQVGAKATRDAFFLSNYDIEHLPTMLVAAAVTSVGVALLVARLMSSRGPARMVPRLFFTSGLLLLAEWALAVPLPRVAAVVVYLHVASFGATIISTFWSLLNERFDPRTAKRQIARIGVGGTFGGVVGGLMAERAGAYLSVTDMLPVLAALHLLCAWRVLRIRTDQRSRPSAADGPGSEVEPVESASGFRVLARVSYLRNLASLVVLGTVAAAFLDYVFKAEAVATYRGGDDLLRFFAVFYTTLSLATFLVQTTLARRALEKFGLARTVASLPAVAAVGSAGALFIPGLASVGAARGAESVLRSSLYRSGYEILYTPIPPRDKRSTKTIVDVGFERLGDALGGGLVKLVLVALPLVAHRTLLALALLLSVLGILVAQRLHKGYVKALEQSLLSRAVDLDVNELTDTTTRMTVLQTLGALNLEEARKLLSRPGIATGSAPASEATSAPTASTDAAPKTATSGARMAAPSRLEPVVERILELRSGDPSRIRRALAQDELTPQLVPHVLPLLAWDEMCEEALKALRKVAHRVPGQLIDGLLDPDEEFAIRRRLPRALCWARNQRAVDGMLLGLEDQRFEVRFQCGRGIRTILDHEPDLEIAPDRVYETVLREVKVDKRVWESHRLLDQVEEEEEGSPFVDEVLRRRASRSLEHVFTVLSLVLPKQPLTIAYRGLHTDDDDLRGTALEYLESVLPAAVRQSLWPFLEPPRKPREPVLKDREAILANLMRSNRSIALNLEALRQKLGDKS